MFRVPAPLHQEVIGSSLCPAPTATTTEDLVHRASCSSLFSMMAGVVMGAAVTFGVMSDSKPARTFATLVTLGAVAVTVREHLKRESALYVLENRARLGDQSIYRYQGPAGQ